MNYNNVFVAQKRAEGRYNLQSDQLADNILQLYQSYVQSVRQNIISSSKHLFNGIVIGNVQSGKTMNFCHVINKAIDDGFQLVVILSSNKNDLNMQTTDRIAEDIVGHANPNVSQITSYANHKKGQDFCSFYNNNKGLTDVGIAISSAVNPNATPTSKYNFQFTGPSIYTRTPNIYWLTACDMGSTGKARNVDFDINHGGGNDTLDTFLKHDPKGCYIAVVKKNTHRLGLLYDFLNNSSAVKNHKIKALFIDDECDEITVSGTGKKLGRSSVQIGEIQKLFETDMSAPCHSMYISYTATPIANICVKNRKNTNVGFPDDFIMLMNPSSKYCGFDAYHDYGQVTIITAASQKMEVKDMVSGSCQSYIDCKKKTPQLYKALIRFIWNCKIFEERCKNNILSENTTSMLVHTNLETAMHEVQKEYIQDVLELIAKELLDELNDIFCNFSGGYQQGQRWSLIDDFYDCYEDIRNKIVTYGPNLFNSNSPFEGCNVNHFPGNHQFSIQFCVDLLSYICQRMPQKSYHSNIKLNPNAKKIQVLEVNSNTPTQLPNNTNFIAVGGNKIARGLTLHNLSVTYFTRSTGALDTLTQMARWFGYRIGYFDICRLYIDDYTPIDEAAEVEKEIRNQVRIQNGKHIKPKYMSFIFTGILSNLLSGKQVVLLQSSYKGGNVFETTEFYQQRNRSRNNKVLDNFYSNLFNHQCRPAGMGTYGTLNVIPNSILNPSRYCYVTNVPFKCITNLLNNFGVVVNKNTPDILLVAKQYMKYAKTKYVNVLLSGRNAGSIGGPNGTSFCNGVYQVSGMAVKKNISSTGSSFLKINPFDDCAEDYVVDYPNPSSLNHDFTQSVGGKTYSRNRDPGYVAAVKTFGQANRTIPLVIITPFICSNAIGSQSINVYYSIQILTPNSYQSCNMTIL